MLPAYKMEMNYKLTWILYNLHFGEARLVVV